MSIFQHNLVDLSTDKNVLFFFWYRSSGFREALTIKDITESIIESIQEFVKNDLIKIFEPQLGDAGMPYFYGKYWKNPHSFKFEPGERMLISCMTKYVRQKVEEEGLQYYCPPENFVDYNNLHYFKYAKSEPNPENTIGISQQTNNLSG